MIPFEEARHRIVEALSVPGRLPARRKQMCEVAAALGRVLAEEARADRDYPPFPRSTRDGYALHSSAAAALPAEFEVVAEIKAGDDFRGTIAAGQCAHIMTGAAIPAGTNAVVMLEHVEREGNRIRLTRPLEPGQNIVPRGSEASAGQVLLRPGTRLGYAELALLAQVGHSPVEVHARPRVALLSTGDEVVEIWKRPGAFQIRNSNTVSLAAQVTLAGGEPVPLPNAPDHSRRLRALMERGLQEDMLVLSGGVSMGKYDLVERVLREIGAEFFFDAVAIRPGKPAVAGLCRGKPVLGLPGNPVSTMVTFELFAVPVLDLLSGAAPRPLPLFGARLEQAVRQKAALTHFLPAQVEWTTGEPVVRELPWQGSGDIVALAQANAFLVVPAEKLDWEAGEWVQVMPRRGML